MIRIKAGLLHSIIGSINNGEPDRERVRLAINANIPVSDAIILIDMLEDTINYVLDKIVDLRD